MEKQNRLITYCFRSNRTREISILYDVTDKNLFEWALAHNKHTDGVYTAISCVDIPEEYVKRCQEELG